MKAIYIIMNHVSDSLSFMYVHSALGRIVSTPVYDGVDEAACLMLKVHKLLKLKGCIAVQMSRYICLPRSP